MGAFLFCKGLLYEIDNASLIITFFTMKLIPVLLNGKVHRLSERALEILHLEKQEIKETPIQIKKLPPDLTILKIHKKEEVAPVVEVPKEPVQEPVPVVAKRGCRNCGKHKK